MKTTRRRTGGVHHAPRRTAQILAFLSALAVAGCTGGERAPDPVQRVDSAGVELVRNAAGERPLALERTVHYRLGGREDDPRQSFFSVSRYSVDTNARGEIAVLDRANYRVVVFDSAGRHLRTMGSEGEGPGELAFPIGLVALPDGGVLVYDIAKRGMVAFGPDGEPTEAPDLPDGVRSGSVAVDGDALLAESSQLGPEPRLVRLDPGGGETVLSSVELPEMKPIRLESCGMSFSGMAPLFAPAIHWDVGAGVVAVAAGVEYRVDVHRGGDLVRSVRRDVPERRGTLELAVEEVGDGMRVGTSGGTRVCEAEEVAEQRGFAETIPAVGDLRVAPDGTLWVQRYRVGEEPTVIDLFDADGAYRGTLPEGTGLPIGFLPDGRVLGSETDEFDVDRLVVASVEIRPWS